MGLLTEILKDIEIRLRLDKLILENKIQDLEVENMSLRDQCQSLSNTEIQLSIRLKAAEEALLDGRRRGDEAFRIDKASRNSPYCKWLKLMEPGASI